MNTDGSFAALVFICPRTECAVYPIMYSEPRWRLSCVSPDRLFCRPIAEHQSGWDENTRGHSGALLIITVLDYWAMYPFLSPSTSMSVNISQFNANKC